MVDSKRGGPGRGQGRPPVKAGEETITGEGMKICPKCSLEKFASEFSKDRSKSDGLRAKCKTCDREAVRAWGLANQDRLRETKKKYYAANAEALNIKNAAWAAKNRDKTSAYKASWRKANPEKNRKIEVEWNKSNPDKRRKITAKWSAANPEARRINAHNRRARKLEAGGKLSAGLAAKLLKLQRGKCACGCEQSLGADYHLDHRMPLALGGSNTDDNIQLLRPECNLQKSAKHPIDFMQQRGFLL